jgi:hypothetical protein
VTFCVFFVFFPASRLISLSSTCTFSSSALLGSDAIVPPSHQGWFSRITQAVGLSSAPLSLETCLHSFCTGDTLEQRDRYHCDRCRERVEARKHMTVSRLPEVLCLHLKRFSHSNGVFGFSTSKVGAAVTYPLDDLDMTPVRPRALLPC